MRGAPRHDECTCGSLALVVHGECVRRCDAVLSLLRLEGVMAFFDRYCSNFAGVKQETCLSLPRANEPGRTDEV